MDLETYGKVLQQKYFDNELSKVIEFLSDVYGEFKLFYPRNAVTQMEDELIFIYEDSIVLVKLHNKESNFEVTEYPKDILNKQIKVSSAYNNTVTELTVHLKSGEVFRFNSIEDSNDVWNNRYIKLIKEIYKVL